jgi:tetratricopeptide (TPR) repeat protein
MMKTSAEKSGNLSSSGNLRVSARICLFAIIYATLACLAGGCGIKISPSGRPVGLAEFHPDSLAKRADSTLATGNRTEAMALYEKALATDPDHQTSLLGLAELHENTNDPSSARHYYRRLAEGSSAKPEYYIGLARTSMNLADPIAAETALNTAAARFPNRADIQYELGCLHLAGTREAQARFHFEKALASKPGHLGSLRKLSDIEFNHKNYAAALLLLERIRTAKPSDFQNNFRIAFIHFQNENFSEALPFYRKAVNSRPASVDARIGLAKTFEKLDRIEAASKSYSQALDHLKAGQNDVPIVLALANLLNKQGEFKKSIKLINSRHGSSPENAGIACALGIALAGEGDYTGAVRTFELALSDSQWSHFASTQIKKIKKLRSYHDN